MPEPALSELIDEIAPQLVIASGDLTHRGRPAPWTGAPGPTRTNPVARRNEVRATLVDAAAELIPSGHTPRATAAARHEFEIWTGDEHGAAVAVAPGLGQPRPKRRGEARGLLVHDVTENELRVRTYVWRGDTWGLAAERVFPRRPMER